MLLVLGLLLLAAGCAALIGVGLPGRARAPRRTRPLPPLPPLVGVAGSAPCGDGELKACERARGAFPRGCRWREVAASPTSSDGSVPSSSSLPSQQQQQQQPPSPPLTPLPDLEYWDTETHTWQATQPAACRLSGVPAPGPPLPWSWLRGSPRTESVPSSQHVTYTNLWYNAGRWHALVDGGRTVRPWRLSRNHEVTPLHVASAESWTRGVRWTLVPGTTLLLDYTFFTHPTAIGHWWEIVAPLFSAMRRGGAPDSSGGGGGSPAADLGGVVLLHLPRAHLGEWPRAVLGAALGVGPVGQLPPLWLQRSSDVPWQQPGACVCVCVYGSTLAAARRLSVSVNCASLPAVYQPALPKSQACLSSTSSPVTHTHAHTPTTRHAAGRRTRWHLAGI